MGSVRVLLAPEAQEGHFRIRVGDWRVIFRHVAPDVIVVRIMHRSRVYED